MNNRLEHFKKVTKFKLVIMCLATLLPIIVLSVLEVLIQKYFGIEYLFLRYLVFALFEIAIILKIVHYILILVKPDYQEKIYTRTTDERNIFLRQKALNFAIKMLLFVNATALIISAYTNPIVFITLAVETLILVLLYAIAYIYYKRKY